MPSIAQILLCVILLCLSYSCAPNQYKIPNYPPTVNNNRQEQFFQNADSCQFEPLGLGYTIGDNPQFNFEKSGTLHYDGKKILGYLGIARSNSRKTVDIVVKVTKPEGVTENVRTFNSGNRTDIRLNGITMPGNYTLELFCASDKKLLVRTEFKVEDESAKNNINDTDNKIQQKVIEQMFGVQGEKNNSASSNDKYSSSTDYIFHPPLNGASGEYFRWSGRLLKKVGDYYLVYVNNPMAQMVNASLVGTPFYSGQTDEGAFAFKLSANNKTILLQDKRITVSGQFTDCVVMLNGRNIPLLTDATVE